jgi:hypothetical protein
LLAGEARRKAAGIGGRSTSGYVQFQAKTLTKKVRVKRKPLSTAACREHSQKPICRKSAAKRSRYLQAKKLETAPSGSVRVPGENVIALLKRFKIIAECY